MLEGFALPVIDAAKPHSYARWFACLTETIHHPHLHEEEKYVWLWLATLCANNPSFSCSFSYEQMSRALNKPPRLIHRILFRLLTMGFLIADIPIWYGALTEEMVQAVRTIKLVWPPKPSSTSKESNVLVLPRPVSRSLLGAGRRTDNKTPCLNLLKKAKPKKVSYENLFMRWCINFVGHIFKKLNLKN